MTDKQPDPNSIGTSLGLLGDEWNLLIIRACLPGAQRYSKLQQALGIAPSVLSGRLTTLTTAQVLQKVPEGGRFAYALTASGQDLWRLLLCIWAWEQRWVQGSALPTMRHLDCHEVFTPVLACRGCRLPVASTDVQITLGPTGDLTRAIPTGSHRRRGAGLRARGPGLFPETMALTGSRWSSALLGSTFLGVRRFSDFQAVLGAPPNIISDRLRTFVSLGVLDAGYSLTAKGRDFFPTATMLVVWGERWFPATDGPALIARHTVCGKPFREVLQCSCCQAELHRASVLIEAASPVQADPAQGRASSATERVAPSSAHSVRPSTDDSDRSGIRGTATIKS